MASQKIHHIFPMEYKISTDKLPGAATVHFPGTKWFVHASAAATVHFPGAKWFVTGFRKTDPNFTFGISRITNLKYLTHCESLLLCCNYAKFTL